MVSDASQKRSGWHALSPRRACCTAQRSARVSRLRPSRRPTDRRSPATHSPLTTHHSQLTYNIPNPPAGGHTMLTIPDQPLHLCDGITRRDWLRVGSLGLGGLSLPMLLQARRARAASPSNTGTKAKSCIVLFFLGGPPQHEPWDPKPSAPPEIRGDLKPISSSVPGLQIGELMPKTAQLAKHLCVLRAVTTDDNAHSSSGYYMTTGHPHQPLGTENAKPGAPNDWPCLGALVKQVRPDRVGLPSAITLPEQSANDGNLTWPGQDAGFFGRASDPWLVNCDPSSPDFKIEGLALPGEVSNERFNSRRSLAQQVNQQLDDMSQVSQLGLYDAQRQQALDLISASRSEER